MHPNLEIKHTHLLLVCNQLRGYYIDEQTEKHLETVNDAGVLEMYSDKALLMRESLRFDPKVRQCLNKIWIVTDSNQNGEITDEEYLVSWWLVGWGRGRLRLLRRGKMVVGWVGGKMVAWVVQHTAVCVPGIRKYKVVVVVEVVLARWVQHKHSTAFVCSGYGHTSLLLFSSSPFSIEGSVQKATYCVVRTGPLCA
jgi:hypothetical protein